MKLLLTSGLTVFSKSKYILNNRETDISYLSFQNSGEIIKQLVQKLSRKLMVTGERKCL